MSYGDSMKVTFEDADGETGHVTDDMTVQYDGQWDDQIRERVAKVRDRYRNGDDVMGEAALSALVTELPEQPRVVEAERHHE